ncbi:MAG: bactofilin family protein [Thermodesulfobacteriota bacterium]
MNFFKRNGHEMDKDAVTSIIGADMRVVGDITFQGKLRLDGKAEGNIRGEYLILGESGQVSGDVQVNTMVCCGRVLGNVQVKKLHMASSGFIDGKVETMDLEVESGAVLNGEIKSRSQQELRLIPGSAGQDEEDFVVAHKGSAGAAG